MSIARLFLILRARWKAVLSSVLVMLAVALAITLSTTPAYTSTASVVVDLKGSDTQNTLAQGVTATSYMKTQGDVITSERVILRAIAALQLDKDPMMIERWRSKTGGVGSIETWLSDNIIENLVARPLRDSNVMSITYSSPDPKQSAAVANAVVKAYVDTILELRIEPARQYNTFFDGRAKELREDYERAQARLSEYERQQGLLSSDNRIDIEEARLSQLSSQVVDLQVSAANTSSRSSGSVGSEDRTQEVLSNSVISGIKTELTLKQSQYRQLQARLGEQHPQIVELRASIDELRTRIAEESRKVNGSLGVSSNVDQARLGIVRRELEAQRAKVMRLKSQRNEAAVLERDVQNAQKAYDAILARLQQTSLDSLNTQSNVSVLQAAKPPLRKSSPVTSLNLALGCVVGLIAGIAIALVREALDTRVRSEEDIAMTVDLPVLVDLSRGSSARPRLLAGVMKPNGGRTTNTLLSAPARTRS
ncbi:chain length determinant protein EpsF [Sphaerotilus hippei]|uniref:Chain length determinant protein EpsF n=1 Tax=Sphaerotilus hippei TaxID=744406 RepID=A0A318H6T4_9BURK|nr:GNVR domain-containing protein [Sphaerotilus hippei]PXW97150.1 chain length determinant protein EpsF [Sphaerotilus hippei]